MDISYDYRDLLKILNKYKVRYLVVGAYAVAYYSEPRFTKDLDVWVGPDEKNAEKIYGALKEFGAPLKDVKIENFTNKNMIYQIGVAPIRVDILSGLGKIKFENAWKRRKKVAYAGASMNIISLQDLISSKATSARNGDIRDAERLKKLLKKRPQR